MRYVSALLVVAAVATAGHAHFVFVYTAEGEARLVFGHAAEPDKSASVERAAKTKLVARDAAGKETPLTVKKGEGNLYRAGLDKLTPVVLFGTTEAGVTQRGDNPPMLSWYYPKVVVGDPFAKGTLVGSAVPLEIIPVRDGVKVKFQVVAAGKPVPDLEVTVGVPGGGEEKAQVVKTDKDGTTTAFAETGRYCVAARRLDETPGDFGGKKYAAVRHTATLVCDVPGK